ncbi:hypothetical protein BHM03_00012835 [Ensete ventricosum]|nr:hypothetical protein BHM03_00012835 [Ensete ventricosum]
MGRKPSSMQCIRGATTDALTGNSKDAGRKRRCSKRKAMAMPMRPSSLWSTACTAPVNPLRPSSPFAMESPSKVGSDSKSSDFQYQHLSPKMSAAAAADIDRHDNGLSSCDLRTVMSIKEMEMELPLFSMTSFWDLDMLLGADDGW